MKKTSSVLNLDEIRVADLFAGCGGLSLGFSNAGFNIVLGADNWEPALKVYKKNFSHPAINLDHGNVAETVRILRKHRVNMIIGGPPCQDFSHAGNRDEDNGKGNLTVSYAQIICQVKPRYFVMENVDRLVKTEKYRVASEMFRQAGYGITAKLLDASYCGVPQKRKRYFVIGELGGEDQALGEFIERNLSDKPMTVRDYFGRKLAIEHYYRHPRNYSRRAIYSIDEPSATIRGVNRPMPDGYPGHAGDAVVKHDGIRPLTTLERSFIQTFPENFIWEGTKSDMEQLIGNAVPVKLAEFVAMGLKSYIHFRTEPQTAKVPIKSRQLTIFGT